MNKYPYCGYSFSRPKKRKKYHYVYVVSHGESCEGHSPDGVYKTFKKAKESYKHLHFIKLRRNVWIDNRDGIDEVYIEKFKVI